MSQFREGFGSAGGDKIFHDTTILRGDRGPCIICGHPTGDCAGTSGPPIVIFGQGISDTLNETQTVLVEEDIFEERQITPYTKSRVLIHRKGKQIPYSEAKRLGLVD